MTAESTKLDGIKLWVVDESGTRDEVAARVKEVLAAAGLTVLVREPCPAELGA